jgi:hypothetical protein
MLKDFTHHDRTGPWRRDWTLRLYGQRLTRWWWRSVLNGWHWPSLSLGTWCGVGKCYCPTSTQSEVRVQALGFGFWLSCDRWRGPLPCLCDLSLWDLYPVDYADEVEEYGGIERVRAELARRTAPRDKAVIPC